MKFVKRISLFFIYPLSMFAIGFASNMMMMDYFYPNNLKRENAKAQEMPVKEKMPVSVMDTPVVTANTRYVIQEYNVLNGQLKQNEETAPDKFIGLDRTKLAQEIENYNTKPSLTDQEKGFTFMELVSFSSDNVVVKKSYEKQEAANDVIRHVK